MKTSVFRKLLINTFILIALLWGTCMESLAQDSLAVSLRIGVYQNQPKIFFDDEQQPSGIFIDILNEIARLEGWSLQYLFCTWNDCIQELENGTIDLMPDMAFSEDRNLILDFNKIPVLESFSQVYAAPEIEIHHFSDLKEKRIAVLDGSIQQNLLKQWMEGYGFPYIETPLQSFSHTFSEVKIGVADAAVVNNYFGEQYATIYGLEKTGLVFNPVNLHFVAKKGCCDAVLKTIDRYLEQWIKTPRSFYYQTLEKYKTIPGKTKSHTHTYFYLTGAFLMILISIFYLIARRKIKNQEKKLNKLTRILRADSHKFKSYIDNAPVGIFIANSQGDFMEVNRTAVRFTGYSSKELHKMNIQSLIPDAFKADARDHFHRVVTTGRASGNFPFMIKSGENRLVNIDAVKISEERMMGFIQDITEKTREQKRLNFLGKIFDQSVNEIYLFDTQTLKITDANARALINTRYSLEELKQMTVNQISKEFTGDAFRELIDPLTKKIDNQVIIESKHIRKDDTAYEVEMQIQRLDTDEEKLFSAIVIDITKRKTAEKELMNLKNSLEEQVKMKTEDLKNRIAELEIFREATIEREHRMEELRQKLEKLKKEEEP